MTYDEIVAEVNRRVSWTRHDKPVHAHDGRLIWSFCDHTVTATVHGDHLHVYESWMGLNADATRHEFVSVEVFADGSTQRFDPSPFAYNLGGSRAAKLLTAGEEAFYAKLPGAGGNEGRD